MAYVATTSKLDISSQVSIFEPRHEKKTVFDQVRLKPACSAKEAS